ncbi:uncharacterized protein LOC117807503 [Notolabrus celidotus]|uniref:uncharacterized protein LOC117807503 n=1 Tax=Notolabrus celidotus TaxID=1203425 RepID=UPI00148FEEEC|nr:uncharacterized protein LOC117807503 [Notolabrus celidotus]
MRNLILITASLLCSLCCICVSETVEVQPGETATLLCSNLSTVPSQIQWFTFVNGSQPRCISHMFESHEPARFCSGFLKGKFEMTSDMSTIFLHIKQVDLSDSGLYFCGSHVSGNPVIYNATFLEVQEAWVGMMKLTSPVLVGLVVGLVMIIICLAVQKRKLQKARTEEQNPRHDENPGSDDLNHGAVTFHPRAERNHRPAPEREVESYAIYSAIRYI